MVSYSETVNSVREASVRHSQLERWATDWQSREGNIICDTVERVSYWETFISGQVN